MEEYMIIAFLISLVTGGIIGGITAGIVAKRKSFRKMNRLLKKAEKAKSDKELVQFAIEKMEENEKQHEKFKNKLNELYTVGLKDIRKVAHQRYDATEDIGGQMSFSLALLNDENNGVILTNIYMDDRTFLYLREINEGKAKISLSDAEEKVLEKVLNQTQ